MTIGKFTPKPVPSNAVVSAEIVEKLACGELKLVEVHADVMSPVSYAQAMASAKYLRQRGIRAAYRNNYTVPRKGGSPYSHGQTILVAPKKHIPEGFTLAIG